MDKGGSRIWEEGKGGGGGADLSLFKFSKQRILP